MENKNNFSHIWVIIKNIDRISGQFIFKEDPWTLKEKAWSFLWPINCIMFATCMISTLILTHFQLLPIILCGAISLIVFAACYCNSRLKSKKEVIQQCFDYCRGLDDLFNQEFYNTPFGDTLNFSLDAVRGLTIKIMKFIEKLATAIALFGSIGTAVVLLFLPEKIHPKYVPPMPFYFPFPNQKTWLAFTITTLIQSAWLVIIVIHIVLIAQIFFSLTVQMLGVLDIIKDIVLKFKDEIDMATFLNKTDKNFGGQKPSTNLLETTKSISFEQWIQIITDLINDVNDKISLFTAIYTGPLLLLEIGTFGCIQLCGLIFMIVKQQQAFGLVMGVGSCFIYFSASFVNEKILQKFQVIADEIYNLPWYDLTPKERKLILVLMNCDKIQSGFNAGHFHNFTLERFAEVIRSAYSNCLVLKDLVNM